MRFFLRPRWLLSAVLFTAILMLGVKVHELGQVIMGVKPLTLSPAPVVAAEKSEDKAAMAANAGGSRAVSGEDAASDTASDTASDAGGNDTDAALDQATLTRSEIDLLQQLAARRTALDAREKEIEQRDALMRIAEKRVDTKIEELNKVKAELQNLLNQANNEQQAQISSLVKIYETMKAKDAARILEALDLPVLLGVISKMKEAKAAPVLAEMDSAKAKEITTALLERKQKFAMPDVGAGSGVSGTRAGGNVANSQQSAANDLPSAADVPSAKGPPAGEKTADSLDSKADSKVDSMAGKTESRAISP